MLLIENLVRVNSPLPPGSSFKVSLFSPGSRCLYMYTAYRLTCLFRCFSQIVPSCTRLITGAGNNASVRHHAAVGAGSPRHGLRGNLPPPAPRPRPRSSPWSPPRPPQPSRPQAPLTPTRRHRARRVTDRLSAALSPFTALSSHGAAEDWSYC